VSIEKCSVINCICYGREGSESDFFYMYGCFFTDAHVGLSFDEFTMDVLRILNVAPTQLHPNSCVKCLVFVPPLNHSFIIIMLGRVPPFVAYPLLVSLGLPCSRPIPSLTSSSILASLTSLSNNLTINTSIMGPLQSFFSIGQVILFITSTSRGS